MKVYKTSVDLRNAILLLETRLEREEEAVKENFEQATSSLAPINLIKSGLRIASDSGDLKHAVFNSSAAMVIGYLFKNFIVGGSINPVKRFVGSMVLVGVNNLISKNPVFIDNASMLIKLVIRKIKVKRAVGSEHTSSD
ncbi:MAG: hypothetical protein WEC59_13070 [Salibacteraceae bacterium]